VEAGLKKFVESTDAQPYLPYEPCSTAQLEPRGTASREGSFWLRDD